MPLYGKIIGLSLYLMSFITAADTLNIALATPEAPFSSDRYYSYPGSNFQLEHDGIIFDSFRWRVATSIISDIDILIENISWSGTENHETNQPNPYKINNYTGVDGENVFCVDLLPWIQHSNHHYSYISQLNMRLIIRGGGKIISGYGYNPANRTPDPRIAMIGETEYIIITNTDLEPAAEIIANLHQNEVDVENRLITRISLMDTLSLSVRQYLLNEIQNNSALKYVLYFGDETIIPPITISTFDPDAGSWINRPSDDFFTSDPEFSAYPQLISGRIPTAEPESAIIYAQRLREYVLDPTPGGWENTMTILADDTNKSGGNIFTEITHTANSNILYHMLKESMDIRTIYGPEYIPVAGGGYLRQPDMTSDVLESINSGTSLMNYIGHGSATTLADEFIIDMDRDIGLIDDPVGCIWVVGTCSFGWYDNKECMTEKLLASETGAIGVISTTFKVSVIANFQYLLRLFQNIDDFIHGENDYRFGDLVYYSKEGGLDYWFHAFGDPAMPLPFPKFQNVLDTANTSTNIQILQPFTIHIQPEFEFFPLFATLRGPDTDVLRSYEFSENILYLSYTLPGDIIYRGEITQDFSLFIPLDTQQCESCEGKLMIMADSEPPDLTIATAMDVQPNIPVISFTGNITDFAGPEISILQGENLIPSPGVVYVQPPYEITIYISDDSGVNVTSSIGHQLRYWIDETESHNFSSEFVFTDANAGYFQFPFPSTDIGNTVLNIEAWDNMNNRSQGQFNLIFAADSSFSVDHIYNYPNPFNDETDFTFFLSHPAEITITVLSQEGRSVKKINREFNFSGYQSVHWDGKGSHGVNIPNGTYFYYIHATTDSGKEYNQIKKLSKLK